jgi:hypothetical protein
MRSSSATPLHSIDFIGSWRRELRFDSKARLSPGAVIGRERPDPLDILARFRALALMFGMPVAPAIDEFELAGGKAPSRRRAEILDYDATIDERHRPTAFAAARIEPRSMQAALRILPRPGLRMGRQGCRWS